MTTATTPLGISETATPRTLAAPPKDSWPGAALTILSLALAASSMFDGPAWKTPSTLFALAALAVVGAAQRAWSRVHLALAAGLLAGACTFGWIWPLPGAAALAAYALIVLAVPPLRRSATWLRRGVFDRASVRFLPAAIILPAVGLVGWFLLFRPELASYQVYPEGFPLFVIVLGVIVFAMANAAVEEALWRGIAMQSTDAAFGAGWVSLVVQAIAFGAWHAHGFPGGPVGMGLAAIFAGMMGYLRMRSRGMLVPWMAHVCADAVILTIILVHTAPR